VGRSQLTVHDELLAEVRSFVERARDCPESVASRYIGSLATAKKDPKDADVLVTVDDDADLTPLAALGRKLKGRAQSRNKGADIFLADLAGDYIGCLCHWRECYPGKACPAMRATAASEPSCTTISMPLRSIRS
jgi:hypothetical protein